MAIAGPTVAGAGDSTGTPALQIDFEGLCLFEDKGHTLVVHLVDGPAVGLPSHLPRMTMGGKEISLKGLAVTGPEPPAGKDDLKKIDGSIPDETVPPPAGDPSWHLLSRVPDLRVLSGAKAIKAGSEAKFSCSITLKHGSISALEPSDFIGLDTVWNCTGPSGLLMRRAFSNKVRYACPTLGKELTMHVGGQTIRVPPTGLDVSVTNLPNQKHPMVGGATNMGHFSAFLKIVDSKFIPTIAPYIAPAAATVEAAAAATPVGVSKPSIPQGALHTEYAGADYCPGGLI